MRINGRNVDIRTYFKKVWEWDCYQPGINPIVYKTIITVLGIIIPVYIITLISSHPGEIAEALGSFLGGIIGAGGAIIAVYLALSRQKDEETTKVSEAVRVEITTFVKYVIGAIEVCEQIAKGIARVPLYNANYIAKNFWFDPIVYPAIADRVGLLPHPQATVEFYMRIGEAKAMLDTMRTKSQQSSATNISAPQELVSKENAAVVADSLITALQLAQPIIAGVSHSSTETALDSMVSQTVLKQINDCLHSAKQTFPTLESFRNAN